MFEVKQVRKQKDFLIILDLLNLILWWSLQARTVLNSQKIFKFHRKTINVDDVILLLTFLKRHFLKEMSNSINGNQLYCFWKFCNFSFFEKSNANKMLSLVGIHHWLTEISFSSMINIQFGRGILKWDPIMEYTFYIKSNLFRISFSSSKKHSIGVSHPKSSQVSHISLIYMLL